ncbi:MAG: YHS domain-containing protein [Acidobacteriota bacterium]
MVKDPVCGMQVNEQQATSTSNYQGQNYYFCSQDCKMKFDENPPRYVSQSQAAKH